MNHPQSLALSSIASPAAGAGANPYHHNPVLAYHTANPGSPAIAGGGGVPSTAAAGGGGGQMTPGAGAGGAGTGFLPGFLMGDCAQQGTGRVVSPTKLNRSVSQQGPSSVGGASSTPVATIGGGGGTTTHLTATPGTPVPPGQRINGFLTPSAAAPSAGTPLRTPSEKPGGPPTKGLFSTPNRAGGISSPAVGGTPRGQMNTPMPSTPHLSFGGTPKTTFNTTANDLNQSASPDGTTWVTVFGFPPSASSYILKQFSQCGTVLQHHAPVNGNWMHIRFQTRTQAQSALSRSGRILGGTLMIGVALCQDADVQAMNAAAAGSEGQETSLLDQSKANVSLYNNTPSRSIRPLTQAYKAAQSEHEVSLNGTTAAKNEGIVTRAMGCIFGW